MFQVFNTQLLFFKDFKRIYIKYTYVNIYIYRVSQKDQDTGLSQKDIFGNNFSYKSKIPSYLLYNDINLISQIQSRNLFRIVYRYNNARRAH